MNTRRLIVATVVLIAAAVSASMSFANPRPTHDIVVHAGTLIDGVSPQPRQHVSIHIHDGRIMSVVSGFISPIGVEIVDLSDSTVMPGFIDAHVHITAKLPSSANATEDWLTHSDIDRALDGAQFAQSMLQQGFTSARDLGGGPETVALRNAINEGNIVGPRLWTSLEPLGPTGGHGDARFGLDQQLTHPGWGYGIVDSPTEAQLRVREHQRRGADLIKIMPSGGIASTGDDPRQQLMTDEEISAAVATAHNLGMRVAAHAYGPAAIDAAVRARADSIEHGSFATAENFALMRAYGTFLVPTLTVYDVYYQVARDHPELLRPGTAAKELENDLLPRQNFPNALRSGVRIVYGTDLGEGDHSTEFRLLIEGGMSPMDAIFAATRNAAELLGAAGDIGSVQQGRFADLVAVRGNPLQSPTMLGQVNFVMQGGTIFRQNGMPKGVQ